MNKDVIKSWILENIDCLSSSAILAGNNTHIYSSTKEESTQYIIIEYNDENYCITIDVNTVGDKYAQFYSECHETNDVIEHTIDLSEFSGWVILEKQMKNILGNVVL